MQRRETTQAEKDDWIRDVLLREVLGDNRKQVMEGCRLARMALNVSEAEFATAIYLLCFRMATELPNDVHARLTGVDAPRRSRADEAGGRMLPSFRSCLMRVAGLEYVKKDAPEKKEDAKHDVAVDPPASS